MEKIVSPFKPITDGQIGKFNEKIAARLRKNNTEISSDVFQEIVTTDDTLIDEVFAAVRKRVEARSNFIIRTVKVNRNRSAKEALKATGRNQYVTDSVVKNMPKAESDEVEVILFKIGRQISDNDLDKEYELRGLKPADPYSQAAVNEADPAFADEHPNGTHWKDADDKWCFATFRRWLGERIVDVDRVGDVWYGFWWFAGVRKSSSDSDTLNS